MNVTSSESGSANVWVVSGELMPCRAQGFRGGECELGWYSGLRVGMYVLLDSHVHRAINTSLFSNSVLQRLGQNTHFSYNWLMPPPPHHPHPNTQHYTHRRQSLSLRRLRGLDGVPSLEGLRKESTIINTFTKFDIAHAGACQKPDRYCVACLVCGLSQRYSDPTVHPYCL